VAIALVALLAAGCSDRAQSPSEAAAPASGAASLPGGADPLSSWNEGTAKRAILAFVARVTTQGGPDFVPPAERIATFDNDGTLWSEQPIYVQFAFALDRVRALAPQHPDWRDREPFKSVLAGDVQRALASGEHGVLELLAATHVGNTTEEFERIVRDWIATARHPRYDRPYTEVIYQPMLELLEYLRANGFKTFIVSGGGADFMRPWVEVAYGIPPEQVVGSRAKLEYQVHDGVPSIARLAGVDLVDDKAGKPVGIQQLIGRRPIAAFGNSDGDFEMLEWTTSGSGPRLGLIVHHTDAVREWAYDRDSHIGTLARALDEAPARGWVVVDMKEDWKTIYPFEAR
jgi:phosphoglycolate phosphatase-like HAD superfamily hydrolase